MSDDGVKRGGKHAIIDADEERKMRDFGMPVRCCDYWPECSHVLAFIEQQQAHADRERINSKGRFDASGTDEGAA